jgi:hypothetical protein
MKKYLVLIFSAIAIFALSGCGGGSSSAGIDDGRTTLFLVDSQGYSYGGIPYKCDSMRDWEVTEPNGEFSFYPPDNCEFNFVGLEGNLFNDPRVDDVVRIVDIDNGGKGEIPYECASFGASSTYNDGSFDYDIDDSCVFYL